MKPRPLVMAAAVATVVGTALAYRAVSARTARDEPRDDRTAPEARRRVAAPQPAPAAHAPAPEDHATPTHDRLRGTVHGVGRRPRARAEVTVSGPGGLPVIDVVRTDARGEFQTGALRPGTYDLVVDAAALHDRAEARGLRPGMSVDLAVRRVPLLLVHGAADAHGECDEAAARAHAGLRGRRPVHHLDLCLFAFEVPERATDPSPLCVGEDCARGIAALALWPPPDGETDDETKILVSWRSDDGTVEVTSHEAGVEPRILAAPPPGTIVHIVARRGDAHTQTQVAIRPGVNELFLDAP